MKIRKKHLSWDSGFVRFKRLEINWHINNWALPLSIDVAEYLIFFQFLFVSFIFARKGEI